MQRNEDGLQNSVIDRDESSIQKLTGNQEPSAMQRGLSVTL